MLRRFIWFLALLAGATHARAEIVELQDGGLLKVVARSARGDVVVLTLAGGGEIAVPRVRVRAFHPDEVAWEAARAGRERSDSPPHRPARGTRAVEAALRRQIGTPATEASAGVDAVLTRYRVPN